MSATSRVLTGELVYFWLNNAAVCFAGEPIKVTLGLFSGEEDPFWLFKHGTALYENIKGPLENAIAKYLTYPNGPSVLGYGGFLVSTTSGPQVIVGPDTIELQKLLLQNIPENDLGKMLAINLLKEIEGQRKGLSKPLSIRRKKRYAPAYNPDYWNDKDRMKINNCYNYATNIESTTGKKARPGRESGNDFPKYLFTNDDVKNAAIGDKLAFVGEDEAKGKEVEAKGKEVEAKGKAFVIPEAHRQTGHLVALFVSDAVEIKGSKCIRILRCI